MKIWSTVSVALCFYYLVLFRFFFSASVYASVLFDAIVNWIAYTSVSVPNIDYFGLRSLSDQTCAQALCFAQTTEKSDLF